METIGKPRKGRARTIRTIKQLARLAGVSVRTLRYYDEIGLLAPESHAQNGYRLYGEAELLRLQQILFFRELGMSLEEIKTILDRPSFDVLAALETHRRVLQDQAARTGRLIQTIERTILFLRGELKMNGKELFDGLDETKLNQYSEEARRRWGSASVDDSVKKWSGYTPAQKAQILAEAESVRSDLLAAMSQGPESAAAQKAVARWHQNLRYYYEPTTERLLGLGRLYVEDPEFRANYSKLHPDLPEFFQKAIEVYCRSDA